MNVVVVIVGAVAVVFFAVFSDVTNIHRDCDLANVAESSVDDPDWRLSRRGVGRRRSTISRGRGRGAIGGGMLNRSSLSRAEKVENSGSL